MGFSMVEGILNLNLNAISTVALAALLLLIGGKIKRLIPVFEKICLPTPVIGGVLFALLNLVFRQTNIFYINLDVTYQTDFQLIFFTIVGFGASIALVKKGGVKLVIYLVITGALLAAQGFVGMATAKAAGVSPAFGIICGPMSMAGGHGTAAAYGEMLESAGYTGALTAAMAAATFGVISGSILGGPLCDVLVRRHKLSNPDALMIHPAATDDEIKVEKKGLTVNHVFYHIALILGFIAVGKYVGSLLGTIFNASIPGFVGPMIVAFVVRNIDNSLHFLKVDEDFLDKMSDFALGLFLSMALMSMNIWELLDLAVPMLMILSVQVIFTVAVTYFLVFRLLGSDFHAAAMCAGLIGHGLGATPNAVANLNGVADKYGRSNLAFLIVPIVGGFLQDVFAVPLMVYFVNLFL